LITLSLYAATKKSNELMVHSYSHLYDLATTGLRFFTVHGPWGRPNMASFLFTDAILNGREIKVFNHSKINMISLISIILLKVLYVLKLQYRCVTPKTQIRLPH
jgi:nucleoside-diphosphate-sugar epimerase